MSEEKYLVYRPLKIGLAQINTIWHSVDKNLRKAEEFIKMSAQRGCDVIVFPEMFTTGFSMETDLTVSENSITDEFLSNMARDFRVNIIAGYVRRGKSKGLNVASIYDRHGDCVARYTKIKPFSLAKEDRCYERGSEPIIFTIEDIPASVFICYDLRFPELFRKVAKDVKVIFVIANWPSTRMEHWKTLLRARAIENLCFVVGVNRTGVDGNNIYYHGGSSIFDPWGDKVISASENEDLLIAVIDTSKVNEIRKDYPFLEDMEF